MILIDLQQAFNTIDLDIKYVGGGAGGFLWGS